jgi:hypothetical protein
MRSPKATTIGANLNARVSTIGLRAEAVLPCQPEHADAIFGRIQRLEHMGNETIVFFDTEINHALTMRLNRQEGGKLNEGDNLAVRPDWSRALFFDEHGQRMESSRQLCMNHFPLRAALAV